jgi:hypothetical protein
MVPESTSLALTWKVNWSISAEVEMASATTPSFIKAPCLATFTVQEMIADIIRAIMGYVAFGSRKTAIPQLFCLITFRLSGKAIWNSILLF